MNDFFGKDPQKRCLCPKFVKLDSGFDDPSVAKAF